MYISTIFDFRKKKKKTKVDMQKCWINLFIKF